MKFEWNSVESMFSVARFAGEGINLALLPKECIGCGRQGSVLCDDCVCTFSIREDFLCPGCWKPSLSGITHETCKGKTHLDGSLIASTRNHPTLARAIRSFKYEGVRSLAAPLAYLLYSKIISSPYFLQRAREEAALMIPVPLHPRKEYLRTFNQSALLILQLCKYFSCAHAFTLVKRKRAARSQTTLSRLERIENPKGTFSVTLPREIEGKWVMAVDDIITTGATMNELARVLKGAGAREVWGVALTHG